MSVRLTLDVWLDGPDYPAGRLEAHDDGSLTFSYRDDYLSAGFPALSIALPLGPEPFGDALARAYFGNLLPENDAMRRVIDREGLDRGDIAGILYHVGADCAGAISCLPEGSPRAKVPGVLAEDYRALEDGELERIVESLADDSRLPDEVRDPSPVAGVQRKIALARLEDGRFALPIEHRNVPTTHILKVPRRGKEQEAALEEASARLAAGVGLDVSIPQALAIGGTEALLIVRFDRSIEKGTVYRIHQEDFAQGLGLPASLKYERDGQPGRRFDAVAIAGLLDRTAHPAEAREAFLLATLFNLAIGNNDNHAKNHGLLYSAGAAPRLSPLYDLLPTRLDPDVNHDLAYRIGEAGNLEAIRAEDLTMFLSAFGIGGAAASRFVKDTARKFLQQIEDSSKRLPAPRMKRFDDLIGRELAQLDEALELGLDLRERDAFIVKGGGWLAS